MASNLDAIHEVYDSVNYNLDINEDDPEKIISDLQQKIVRLEKMNNDLKAKNEDLKKNNIENDSVMKKMGHVGLRRKFTAQGTLKKVQNDSVKIAELIKEKDDLQEMNEKMLDLLTEKEIEIEDLQQKLEDYKLEVKIENEKNLEKIQNLEDKVDMLENSKGGTIYDIDEVVNEYDKSKERLKQQINDYSKSEKDLKSKLEMKDRTIDKLNEDIQKLEIEKLQLINQNAQKDKQLKEKDLVEIEQLKTEINKLKREITFLNEKLNVEKNNSEKLSQSNKTEIEKYQKRIEEEQNNNKNIREEKLKEINLLKADIAKINKELNLYTRKAEIAEKRLDDEKQKNFMIQNKLDKKGKELNELNEYTKKLLNNKDNLISQYEERIEEMTKNKNDLIIQNKQLLENLKIKNDNGESMPQSESEEKKSEENNGKNDIEQYIHENKLLKEEIKELKEQLDNQAKDLIDLNSFEKEIVRLRAQNESLTNDNKLIKSQLEELKKNAEEYDEVNPEDGTRKRGFTQMNDNRIRKITITGRKYSRETQMSQLNFKKQLNALKKIKEEEKKDLEDRIENIYLEVADLKYKNLNLQYINDELKIKYKNMIKSVTSQCNKKGIKLNLSNF